MFFSDFKSNFNNLEIKYKILTIIIFLIPISLIIGPATMEPLLLISLFIYVNLIYKKEIKLNFNLYISLILLFYFLTILSSLISNHQLFSLKSSLPTIRFVVYVYIFSFLLEKNKWIIRYYFIFIFSLLCITVLDGYIQSYFGYNSFLIKKLTITTTTGFFGDEKKLGRYLVVILSLTIGLFLLQINKKSHIFYFSLFVVLVNTLIIFTSERVALIYGLIVVVIFISLLKKIFGKNILYLFLLPAIIYFLFYNFEINYFNQKVFNSFNQITEKRTKLYFFSKSHENFADSSIKLFKMKPILGIGPKNFRKDCNVSISKYKEVKNCSTHAHNIFIQLLSEAGIFATLIYLFFIYKLLEIVLKSIFFKKNYKEISLIFFILPTLFYLNPLLPSGSFFNNWNMMMGTFPLPFYLYFKKKYELEKK
tara:strand:- start:495 stop:1760 length:1266 start_codon:yes stop_codon:yes gene_type:complete